MNKKILFLLLVTAFLLLPEISAEAKKIKWSSIKDEAVKQSIESYYSMNIDGNGYFETDEVKYLNLSRLKSTDDLKIFPNLEKLFISEDHDFGYKNVLKSIDISGNKKLKILSVSNCSLIKKLNVSKNTKLEELNIHGCNKITSLDLSKNEMLKKLNVISAGISKLDISKNHLLEILCLRDMDMEKLFFPKSNNLKRIILLGCKKIKGVDVSNYSNLVELNLNGTSVSKLDVSKNKKLKYLDVANTKVKGIDVTKNNKLYMLYCHNTAICNLDLSNNPKLSYLWVYNTKIKKLDVSRHHVSTIHFSPQTLTDLKLYPKSKIPTSKYFTYDYILYFHVDEKIDVDVSKYYDVKGWQETDKIDGIDYYSKFNSKTGIFSISDFEKYKKSGETGLNIRKGKRRLLIEFLASWREWACSTNENMHP